MLIYQAPSLIATKLTENTEKRRRNLCGNDRVAPSGGVGHGAPTPPCQDPSAEAQGVVEHPETRSASWTSCPSWGSLDTQGRKLPNQAGFRNCYCFSSLSAGGFRWSPPCPQSSYLPGHRPNDAAETAGRSPAGTPPAILEAVTSVKRERRRGKGYLEIKNTTIIQNTPKQKSLSRHIHTATNLRNSPPNSEQSPHVQRWTF